MAKYETRLTGTFDQLVNRLNEEICHTKMTCLSLSLSDEKFIFSSDNRSQASHSIICYLSVLNRYCNNL